MSAQQPSATEDNIHLKCPKIAADGLTEIWVPDESQGIVADLCYVHGLMGHPRKSWQYKPSPEDEQSASKSKKESKFLIRFRFSRSKSTPKVEEDDQERGCFWPFDLVRNDFENVRILTYGYDSHPTHFYKKKTNQMNITQHAGNLLQHITDCRSECRGRPIIFVCHSLGGILVKDMIIQSGKFEQQPKFLDVGASCRAIFFFGTPHLGASIAKYGEMLTNIVDTVPGGFSTYREVLHGLQPDGEKLSNVNSDFNDILNKRVSSNDKIQIYSFQEAEGLTKVNLFDGQVVPNSSSCYNRRDIEQKLSLSKNHKEMCKFSDAKTSGYTAFKSALKGYINDINQAMQTREKQNERQAFLECLEFEECFVRQQQLSNPITIKESFEWVWESSLVGWLQGAEPLFWISGSPASGKSTLINYIATEERTRDILNGTSDAEWEIVSFFFDFRAGERISNSLEGLLRSLLMQLIHQIPSILDNNPVFEKKPVLGAGVSHRAALLPSELLQGFEYAIEHSETQLLILLDGLDEYEGNKTELVIFIKSLCKSSGVKICLASREEPPYRGALDNVPNFKMHILNKAGVKAFVGDRLISFFSDQPLYEKDELLKLAKKIAKMAQGVFLWARFAVFEVIDGMTRRGEKIGSKAIDRRLERMPKELESIYSRIFDRTGDSDRKTASIILALVCSSQEMLGLELVQEAVCLLEGEFGFLTDSSLFSTELGSWELNDLSSFRQIILTSTGGCVEIYDDEKRFWCRRTESRLVIRLMHRTVKTFLETGNGWEKLLGRHYSPGFGHEAWLRICAKNIDTTNLVNPVPPDGGYSEPEAVGVFFSQPLVRYSIKNMLNHAYLFESLSKQSSYHMVHSPLSKNFFADLHDRILDKSCLCSPGYGSCFHENRTPIDLVVGHGLQYFVADYLTECEKKSASNSHSPVHSMVSQVDHLEGASRFNLLDQDTKKTIPRIGSMAIAFACTDRHRGFGAKVGEEYQTILETNFAKGNISSDTDVASVLVSGSAALVKVVTDSRTGINQLRLDKSMNWQDELRGYPFDPQEKFGPFWFVAFRTSQVDSEAIVDLLLNRGEKINNQCGPTGMVFHSYVDCIYNRRRWDSHQGELIELLVRKGADINQTGPYGTPLEYLWNRAHKRHGGRRGRGSFGFEVAIGHFIDLGAVNRLPDPNGLVPTVQRMRNWEGSHVEQNYYYHGPREGSI